MKQITEHIYTSRGSVMGDILRKDGHVLLIDVPEFPAGNAPELDETVDVILPALWIGARERLRPSYKEDFYEAF